MQLKSQITTKNNITLYVEKIEIKAALVFHSVYYIPVFLCDWKTWKIKTKIYICILFEYSLE